MKNLISAIICTHNREEYLGAAIDSLLQQDFQNFEVIVVDNASSDRTRDLVESRQGVKYIYEAITGLSVARNTGAKAARGDIIAYLDDDAVASPQWLKSIDQAYQNNQQLMIAGGKVILLWPKEIMPPRWISANLSGNLGFYDLGDQIIYINDPKLTPRGLNYSIRRTFLEEIGGFNINLGRVGKNLLSNEELHITELALKMGKEVAYLPEALVLHNVAPERLHRQWFLNRSWWQGISECYREYLSNCADSQQLIRGTEKMLRGGYQVIKNFRNPAESFDNLVYTYGQIGYLTAVIQCMLKTPDWAKN